MSVHALRQAFVHLGAGATAVVQPPLHPEADDPTGMKWYEDYAKRHPLEDGEGWLVSMNTFKESWPTWEMHPKGAELVLCTQGSMVMTQEPPGGEPTKITLTAGEYAINPAGVWHIVDIDEPATAVFITAGEGTQIRPR